MAMMTGTSTAATSPAAKPLLYRLRPACSDPTLNAADECTSPATTPQCQPKRPAMGASVVPNSAASRIDGSAASERLEHRTEEHPEHDRDDVPRMLAERREADDGQYRADHGPVELAADRQHVERADRARQPHVGQRRPEAGQRDEIGRGLAGRGDDLLQPRRQRAIEVEADPDHRREQRREKAAEEPVVAGGPDHHRIRNEPVRLVHGDDQRAHDAGGEAHVVQAEAHVRPEQLRRRRGQDEADDEARDHRQRHPELDRQRGAEQDLGKDRGERGAEERGVDVGGERLAPESRVQEDAEDDRPDVEQVLAEQAEPQHQEQAGDRRAGDLGRRDAVDQAGGQGEQAGVRAGRADAAHAEIVGQQRIARQEDVDEAAQDPVGTVDDETEHDERGRVRGNEAQDDAVGQRPDVGCLHGFNGHAVCRPRIARARHPDRRAAASGARIPVHRRGCGRRCRGGRGHAQHPDPGVRDGDRQQRAHDAEDRVGGVAPGGHAQRRSHVGAAAVPRDQRGRRRRRIADGARQHDRCEPPPLKRALEHPSRQHDGDVLVGGDDVGRDDRGHEGGDQRAVRFRLLDDRRDQPFQHAGLLHHPAERERGDDEPDRVQHAVHAAAGRQHVHRREARGRRVPARQREPDALEQRQPRRQVAGVGIPDHALGRHDHGEHAAGERAEEDRRERRGPEQGEHDDHRERQEQHRRDVKRAPDRVQLGGRVVVAGLAQQEEHPHGDRQRHQRGQRGLPEVRVEADAGGGGGEIGRVGERRRLVAEIGARDHRAGGDGRVEPHVDGDAHEADADRADDRPRAADAGRDDAADRAGGQVEVVRAEQLQPVVDHRHQRAAHRPGADQRADGEQDEDRADARGDAFRRRLAEGFERMAAAPADEKRQHRGNRERHLVRAQRARIAEQEIRKRHQRDEAADRDDRLGQRQRLRLVGSLHVLLLSVQGHRGTRPGASTPGLRAEVADRDRLRAAAPFEQRDPGGHMESYVVPFLKLMIMVPVTLLPIINPLSTAPVFAGTVGVQPRAGGTARPTGRHQQLVRAGGRRCCSAPTCSSSSASRCR